MVSLGLELFPSGLIVQLDGALFLGLCVAIFGVGYLCSTLQHLGEVRP